MSGNKIRTNPVLVILIVLMCLGCGAVFTQSSADTQPFSENGELPDMFVAGNVDDSAEVSDGKTQKEVNAPENPEEPKEPEAPGETPAPTETPVPAEASEKKAPIVSPEAEKGVWTASGSDWMFLVDGTPHTGWLYDTDGKCYYFNNKGIMKRGWLDYKGKRYYLDLDGILQAGDVLADGKIYHFLEDGSLDSSVSPVDAFSDGAPAAKAEPAKAPEGVVKAESTVTPEPTVATEPTEAPEPEKKETKKKKKKASEEKKHKTIAFTFDDGPSSFTDRLLDCLEENKVKATFFMVGEEIRNFPDAVKRMEALGCELGNHSYTHTDLTTLSPEDINAEIAGTDELLLELAGHGATVVRPPYGSIDESVSATVGTPMILWSVDTLDWETLDVEQTVDTILSEAQDGAIILMHDIYETTVEAVEIAIPQLIEQGYELVTVHELAETHGVTLNTGVAYGSMTEEY